MKKILFTILAVAAMVAACTKFEQETTPDYDSVTKPEVTVTVVSDSSITVTVAAAAGTHYWGYAVMTGAPGATADNLVAGGYAKDANVVLQGAEGTPQAAYVKYTEETTGITLMLTDLDPYTDYTVYAAAVTKMGVLSEVAEVTVKTSDATEPAMDAESADYEVADGVMTFAIPFDDAITLTGEGSAKAYIYAENYADANGYLVAYKEVEIPAENMAASGNYLLISVPAEEYIPGAWVSMTYSADLVVNGAGIKNPAFEKNLMAWIQGELLWNGIVGQYDYANWDFSLVDPATLPDEEEGEGEMEGEEEEEEEKVPTYFSSWKELMMMNWTTSEYPLAGATGDDEVAVTTKESNGRTVTYAAKSYGMVAQNIVAVMLNEAPAYGSTVSYTIAEGSFCDIFGNVNNEFTADEEYFFSYGYTLDDIVGSYAYGAYSAYTGAPVSGTWTIVASDKAEKGNVMFTEMYSVACKASVYATFDMVSGTLTIPSLQVYDLDDKYYYAFCSSDNSGNIVDTDVVFAVPQAGLINGQNGYFGDGAFDLTGAPLGFFDVFYGFQAQRTEAAPAQSVARTRTAIRAQF